MVYGTITGASFTQKNIVYQKNVFFKLFLVLLFHRKVVISYAVSNARKYLSDSFVLFPLSIVLFFHVYMPVEKALCTLHHEIFKPLKKTTPRIQYFLMRHQKQKWSCLRFFLGPNMSC